MCNFSQGFFDQGLEKGLKKGMEQGIGIGEINGELRNAVKTLRALMKRMCISFDEAVDMVGYSEELAARCKKEMEHPVLSVE